MLRARAQLSTITGKLLHLALMFRLRLFPAISIRSNKFAAMFVISAVLLFLWTTNLVCATELSVKFSGGFSQNSSFSRDQLREIFFARRTRWPDGKPIRVFVLPDQHPLHIRFSKEILGVYPYQLRAAWDRMVYSGTGVPPTVVENVEEMRSKIEQTPGGIGYIEE